MPNKVRRRYDPRRLTPRFPRVSRRGSPGLASFPAWITLGSRVSRRGSPRGAAGWTTPAAGGSPPTAGVHGPSGARAGEPARRRDAVPLEDRAARPAAGNGPVAGRVEPPGVVFAGLPVPCRGEITGFTTCSEWHAQQLLRTHAARFKLCTHIADMILFVRNCVTDRLRSEGHPFGAIRATRIADSFPDASPQLEKLLSVFG
jgi:hypothetical protein